MSTIEWQSKASVVYESISKGKILPLSNGGNSYDIQAALALSTCNNLTPSKKAILKNNESFIAYFLRSKFNKPSEEIIIREPYPIACGSYDSTKKYVGIVHHLDPVIENKSWKHRWRNLRYSRSKPESCTHASRTGLGRRNHFRFR
jgi:hypothetical protein